MASEGDRAASSLALLLLVLLAGAGATGYPKPLRPNISGGGVPSMVLPLFLSLPNSTRRAAEAGYFRRRQLSTANARMRLYDDLLTNGYYTTRLYIGTPPQEFALIVDSGSTVTYVPCSSCEQCGNHQDPRFQPELSSTYEPVKCNIDCTCDQTKTQCVYERQYAEMSSSSGVLGKDLISFGKESSLMPQRAVFGCENSETGDLFSQHADGIIGLGRGQLSIMDQLVKKGVINDSFSLCYGGMDVGGGAMVLGGISAPSEMVFSLSDPVRSPYYNIELREIHVAGKRLQLDPRIFDRKHGTILDSGTTYAYLPEEAFVAFRDAIMSKLHSLKQIRGPDPNYKDICFAGAGSDVSQLSKTFPEVAVVFGNGQKLSLSPENYLFRHSKVQGAYCLGIFQNGKDPTTLLGGIIVRNTLVTYDRQNQKIGFWKTNCSELWERLHVSGAPSPVPSSSSYTNSTIEISPALAPSGLQGDVISGPFQVGLITFDMSLNVTYEDLEPHVSELAELIAHELELSSHQIQLMNITSKGNGTLIRWAIFPAGSADFISNTTAMGIISRLTEHRLRLPENFGSYQLVEWNVEPPSRRTWWQRHLLAMVVGISMVVLLSFSALLIWYFWRHKFEGPRTYRPVDSAVPEQELQPL
ncbi:aspartic proteinase-like protein 2 [Cocos nucifera]|uniref:Aspartic proteinase-like protein 2 n=1 Tax=Cocos nucifera TaxID=13894 RepID=A0A8K0ITK6_COCNU|nr:aspartic proteinase-like protein 2 [Cocos nucifera]